MNPGAGSVGTGLEALTFPTTIHMVGQQIKFKFGELVNERQLNNIMDNIIRFIAGERPSADKFNALVAYFSQNSQVLNNALGDIRGENNPFSRNGVTLNRLTIPWGRIGSDDSVDGTSLLKVFRY